MRGLSGERMKLLRLAIPAVLGSASGCARLDAQRRAEEPQLENLRTHQPALYEIERAERRRQAEQGDPGRAPSSQR